MHPQIAQAASLAGWRAQSDKGNVYSCWLYKDRDPTLINALEGMCQRLLGSAAEGGRGLHTVSGQGGVQPWVFHTAEGSFSAQPPERLFYLAVTYLKLPIPGFQVRTAGAASACVAYELTLTLPQCRCPRPPASLSAPCQWLVMRQMMMMM